MVRVKAHTRKTKDGKTVRVKPHTRSKPNKTGKGRKVEVKLYSFDELPEEVQERLLDKYRMDAFQDQYWAEMVVENFKENTMQEGVVVKDVDYEIYSPHGDYTRFEAYLSDEDFMTFVKANNIADKFGVLEPLFVEAFVEPFHGTWSAGRGTTVLADFAVVDDLSDDEIDEWVGEDVTRSELRNKIADFKKFWGEWVDRKEDHLKFALRDRADELISDEQVAEMLSQYEFTRGGKIWLE